MVAEGEAYATDEAEVEVLAVEGVGICWWNEIRRVSDVSARPA